jgi:hypothetical protein
VAVAVVLAVLAVDTQAAAALAVFVAQLLQLAVVDH